MTKSIIELAIEAGWEDEQFSNRFPIMAKEFHKRLERFSALLKSAHLAELCSVEMPTEETAISHARHVQANVLPIIDTPACTLTVKQIHVLTASIWKQAVGTTMAQLLAGVEMPEPTDFCDVPFQHIWGYTADQLRTAVAAAVAKKDAEMAELKADLETERNHVLDRRMQIDALKSERDALAKDAARYRWLRDHHNSEPPHKLTWYLPRTYPLNREGLDAAIDEVMK
jgi:hypothetical protein